MNNFLSLYDNATIKLSNNIDVHQKNVSHKNVSYKNINANNCQLIILIKILMMWRENNFSPIIKSIKADWLSDGLNISGDLT